MKLINKISLQIIIPLVLFIIISLLSLYTTYYEFQSSTELLNEHATHNLRDDMTLMQITLSNLFLKDDTGGAQSLISQIGSNHNYLKVILFNNNGRVINTNINKYLGYSFKEIAPDISSNSFKQVQENMMFKMFESKENKYITGLCPITIKALPKTLGILYLQYDLSYTRQESYTFFIEHLTVNIIVYLILFILLSLFLHYVVSRRAKKIISVIGDFSSGKQGSRCNLRGSDELAQIGHNFNKMASTLKKDTEIISLQSEITKNMSEGVYLIKFEDLTIIYTNPMFEKMFGYNQDEMVGKHVSIVNAPDMVPKETSSEIIEILTKTGTWKGEILNRKKDGTTFWCFASVSLFEHPQYGRVMVAVQTDISQRKLAESSVLLSKISLEKLSNKLHKNLIGTVEALASAVEYRDHYTAGHSRNVADLACAIAKDMGLQVENIETLKMAGMLHDIGKIGIPMEILLKPNPLTKSEFDIIKTHSEIGYELVKSIDFTQPIARIILEHHERLNGSGYPLGKKDTEILLESKILAVADVVEAMSLDRPYRDALGLEFALEEISKQKGIFFDSEIVDSCIKIIKNQSFIFHKGSK